MLKKLFKDTVIYGVASAINGSLSLLLMPFLTRTLSLQEYGIMELLLSTFLIVNIVITFEVSQAIARYYPTANFLERCQYASTGWWFILFMYTIVFLFAVIMLQPLTEIIIGDIAYRSVTLISFFSMLIYGLFVYLQIQLRWALKPFYYASTTLLFIVLSLGLTYTLINFCHMRLEGFFIARIIAATLAGMVCWYYARGTYQLTFDINLLKKMLRFSSPLVISSIGIFISVYVDRFIIRSTLSLSDLGIYSACARIASVAGSFITIVNFALTPLIYSTYKNQKTPAHLAFLFKLMVYIMLVIFLLLLLFGKKILLFLVGDSYIHGYLLLPVLVASFIITGLYNCAPGLWIANKTTVIASINLAGAALNICLCFVFIPYLGYLGAGVATLCTSVFMLLASTHFAQKYYYISYDWLKIISAISLTIIFAYCIIRNSF